MPIRGLSITKSTPFRGGVQEFSNVYHFYNEVGGVNFNDFIDNMVLKERDLHSSAVTFVRARLWSAGGTAAENETLMIKDLTGTGTGAQMADFDPERALLINWDLGRDILGRKTYLRKWFHPVGRPAGVSSYGVGALDQQAPIPQLTRDIINGLCADLEQVGVSEDLGWVLCSPRGMVTPDETAECYPWVEHRQFGNMWRAS